jgi:dephospho-CoA kinase
MERALSVSSQRPGAYPRIRDAVEVAPDGAVDRAKVGQIVFADPEQLSWLEAQVHPLVGQRIGEWLGSLPAETELAVIETPLLFEAGMDGIAGRRHVGAGGGGANAPRRGGIVQGGPPATARR